MSTSLNEALLVFGKAMHDQIVIRAECGCEFSVCAEGVNNQASLNTGFIQNLRRLLLDREYRFYFHNMNRNGCQTYSQCYKQ